MTIYIDDLKRVKHEALERNITLKEFVNRTIKKYLKEEPCPKVKD